MTRRELLTFFAGNSADVIRISDREMIQAGLEPYTQPLSREAAYHLLRRLSFGPTLGAADSIIGKMPGEAVDILLGTGTEQPPEPPNPWVNESYLNPYNLPADQQQAAFTELTNKYADQSNQLQLWWLNLMLGDTVTAREKLTLFWSGHFTSKFSIDDILPPQSMYRQNQLIRSMRQGNFRSFAEEITLDGAMTIFLSGQFNNKDVPNENYARELQELFTIGIGNYTEHDIKEVARTLTGWHIPIYSDDTAPNGVYHTYFKPDEHDTGAKQIYGRTIPARSDAENTEILVREGEIRQLIRIIHEQRTDALSKFICRKIYRYFVYSNPSATDEQIITDLADLFRRSDYELRPVLRKLFTSAHFFDQENIGVQIKTPVEYCVGLMRQLFTAFTDMNFATSILGQTVLDPPNVAGWSGYRSWISTRTYPIRKTFASDMLIGTADDILVEWAKKFPNYTDTRKFVTGVAELLLPGSVSGSRIDRYVTTLLQGAPIYEWATIIESTDHESAAVRLRGLLNTIIKAPDFNLS